MNLAKYLFIGCSLFSITALASYEDQFCNKKMLESTPTQRFIMNDEGLATDTVTNLQWMRCLAGQTWSGTTCEGEPLDLALSAAMIYADSFDYAGKSDWRIPNIKELSSIVELSCRNPALNPVVFPNSWFNGVNEIHYSSTPFVEQGDEFWSILFYNGEDMFLSYSAYEEIGTNFRMVRDSGQ